MSGMSLTRLKKSISCFTLPIMDWRDTTSISTQSTLRAILVLLILSMQYAKKLRVVKRMDDVSNGREIPPQYNEPVFPQIPADFYSDDKKPKAKNKAAGKQRRVLI